ncbi:MAG: sugar phosphate nucleotidyltransferase [Armatimonadetes bacterium]|nr:sugar phosphate nucleotidyltransferase [Armatimonadota bacterium]
MKVRKAVITAAGRGTRQYPATNVVQKELLPIVDVDGLTRPALQIIVAEALAAGIEEIGIVVGPANGEAIRQHFQPLRPADRELYAGKGWALREADRLAQMAEVISFILQPTPEGFGHAVYCARQFVGDDPFLLLLGDHLYLSDADRPCARQVMDVFERYGYSVSSVAVTPEHLLHLFGTVRGKPLEPGIYEVEKFVEKPSPQQAEAELETPGLPAGHYLCFFGMHVFTPAIFEALEYLLRHDLRERGEIQLTTAQELMRSTQRCLACTVTGRRYDIGTPEGYLATLIAFGLRGPYRGAVEAAADCG